MITFRENGEIITVVASKIRCIGYYVPIDSDLGNIVVMYGERDSVRLENRTEEYYFELLDKINEVIK